MAYLEDGHRLVGDGTWNWNAQIDGDDIVVRHVIASWFGGDSDPEDDGRTASGLYTKGHPEIMGCALPMRGFVHVHSTEGSPIPKLPFKSTMVKVWCAATNKTIVVPIIDIGPSKYTNHAIDLTVAAFLALGGKLRNGIMACDYRILHGAALAEYTGYATPAAAEPAERVE